MKASPFNIVSGNSLQLYRQIGDESLERVLVHLCRCDGVWDGEFARQISARWITAENRYHLRYQSGDGGLEMGRGYLIETGEPGTYVANVIARRADGSISVEHLERGYNEIAEVAFRLNAAAHVQQWMANSDIEQNAVRRTFCEFHVPTTVYV